jgi:hypothetical protein
MQTDGFTPATGQKYKSTLDCVKTVWRTEGSSAFIRGLGPTLIRRAFIALYNDIVNTDYPIGHHLLMVQRSLDSNWPCVH